MLRTEDIEALRRSAAMAPLSQSQVIELIESCDQMARERAEIAAVLAQLPATVTELRVALNRLHRLLH